MVYDKVWCAQRKPHKTQYMTRTRVVVFFLHHSSAKKSKEMTFNFTLLTNQHAITLFSQFAVKKVEYHADWSERTNHLTITLFHRYTVKKEIVLIGERSTQTVATESSKGREPD